MKTNAVYPSEQLQILSTQAPYQTSKTLRSRNVIDLSFTDITYSVNLDNKNQPAKQILKGVTGHCPGGHVTAILGSSGAGKTTLLNILAGRVTSSKNTSLSGQLLANNNPYDYDLFSQFASYVMQNDVLMETMTPRESFTFVANLKYNDVQIKQSRVEETIKCLKLQKCQNTTIGGITMKGISGGERKRTSIGYELVSNPSCVLLDEPTSGLDSFTAFQIIYQLKKLAEEQDRTIIFTIHQPSTDIFLLFDRIMLLVQGQFIYQGQRENIVKYFADFGFKCPDHSNPMDYLISIMHTEKKENFDSFPLYFQNYQEKLEEQVKDSISNACNGQLIIKTLDTTTGYQIYQIAQRSLINFSRDPMQLRARIFSGIFLGLLHGGVFWGIGENNGDVSSLFSVAGSLFFLCINLTMGAVMQTILGFTVEREVFLREENSKLYTTTSYFIGKQFIDVPFCILQPLFQGIIAYWMCSYNYIETEIVIVHLFISILLFLCANSMGLMAGCSFNDLKAATSITPMILMPLIIFSGFFANSKDFFVWIGWVQYLSPMKYAFEAISLNEYLHRNYFKDPAELYDFQIGIWGCIGILIGFIFLYRLMAFLFLYGLKSKLQ